jgi:hypothetical protein
LKAEKFVSEQKTSEDLVKGGRRPQALAVAAVAILTGWFVSRSKGQGFRYAETKTSVKRASNQSGKRVS